jgi:hypothetical protein
MAIPQIAKELIPRSRRATLRKVPPKLLLAILSETASLSSGEFGHNLGSRSLGREGGYRIFYPVDALPGHRLP